MHARYQHDAESGNEWKPSFVPYFVEKRSISCFGRENDSIKGTVCYIKPVD